MRSQVAGVRLSRSHHHVGPRPPSTPPRRALMDSPSEEVPKAKKRGRPKKIDLGPDDRASSSSRDASAPPTPAAVAPVEELDPLAAQEVALFGVAGTEEILPPPPADGVGASVVNGNGHTAGQAKRTIGAADPSAQIGRAHV